MEKIIEREYLTGESRRMLDRIRENFYKKRADLPGHISLDVAVVGAGIAGLASAISLRLRNHRVTVYEEQQLIESIGYGIQVAPNLSRLLERLGVGQYLEEHYTRPHHLMFRRWQNGKPVGIAKLQEFETTYGSPYLQVNRGHLHGALLKRALALGVVVRQNSKVVAYNTKAPSLTFKSGSEVHPDLIVAASGVKSTGARSQMASEGSEKYQSAEFAAYRVAVEIDTIKQHHSLRWVVEYPHQNAWIGPDRHVMAYPINGNALLNVVTIAPLRGTRDPALYHAELLQDLAGWDPTILALIKLAPTAGKWPIWTAPHLPRLVAPRSRFVVVGDAAHDMTPYLGQGAAQAVEDAALLGRVLSYITGEEDLAPALRLYERLRLPRTTVMKAEAIRTRDRWHMKDGEEQVQRDRDAERQLWGLEAEVHLGALSDPACQRWLYDLDVEKALLSEF